MKSFWEILEEKVATQSANNLFAKTPPPKPDPNLAHARWRAEMFEQSLYRESAEFRFQSPAQYQVPRPAPPAELQGPLDLMNRYGADLKWPFSQRELKRGWRRALMTVHPDHQKASGSEDFLAAQTAYHFVADYIGRR